MFTGIVKEMGEIADVKKTAKSGELTIKCSNILDDIAIGDSIAVDGICLTVTKTLKDGFKCDASVNTIGSTTLKDASSGDIVNLEDALEASDKLGGHMVTGHIDSTAKLLSLSRDENAFKLSISLPDDLRILIAPKGSVAINGISLTVVQVSKEVFTVYVIPHTYRNTNISMKKPGDLLNLECDILARYIVNFLNNKKDISQEARDRSLKEKLIKYGYYKR